MKNIAAFNLKKIFTSDYFSTGKTCKAPEMLFPDFLEKVNNAIAKFNEDYPDVEVVFVETYRSNEKQLEYFRTGASKIKKDGMHHFGVAVDLAFKINGQFSYKGDYDTLRKHLASEGLTLLGAWDIGHVQYISVASQNVLREAVHSAIVNFQREHNLSPDGAVGPKTIAKLKEVYPEEPNEEPTAPATAPEPATALDGQNNLNPDSHPADIINDVNNENNKQSS